MPDIMDTVALIIATLAFTAAIRANRKRRLRAARQLAVLKARAR
jgi:hypothetical protein